MVLIILSRWTVKKGDHHRRRGRNNRARLRDKNGNGRENVAARTWKDVALRRRLTRSPVETRSGKPDGNMNGARGKERMRPDEEGARDGGNPEKNDDGGKQS